MSKLVNVYAPSQFGAGPGRSGCRAVTDRTPPESYRSRVIT